MHSRFIIAALASLTVALASSCERETRVTRSEADAARFRQSVATQKTINRYFHDAVVPKLTPCWDQIQGRGTIEIKYLFADDGKGRWSFQKIQSSESNLPRGQDTAAVACMQKAVAGTSLPREKGEKGDSYMISWAWPVPLPPDAKEQVARMWGSNGGDGGGCDGRGARARCLTCKGSPLTCVYVCVGSSTCEVLADTGTFNSICTEGGKCASGGPFGLIGAVIF